MIFIIVLFLFYFGKKLRILFKDDFYCEIFEGDVNVELYLGCRKVVGGLVFGYNSICEILFRIFVRFV